jgi:hypothetical protein
MTSGNKGSNKGWENLKPYAKGQSGNPSGRPKTPQEVKDAFRKHTMEAKDVLVSIMNDAENKAGDRVRAAVTILNRAWGTPEQAVTVAGAIATADVDTSKLQPEQQDALLTALSAVFLTAGTDEAETTD